LIIKIQIQVLYEIFYFGKIFNIKDKKNTLLVLKKNPFFNTNKENGYFLEILFHGLNYNAKRIKRYRPQYFLDVHKSEVFVVGEQALMSLSPEL
jgi:hypothetical protein